MHSGQSLPNEEVDIPAVTFFICSLHGFAMSDINDARYNAFMQMISECDKGPLSRQKKINCSSLPPCAITLRNPISEELSMLPECGREPTRQT